MKILFTIMSIVSAAIAFTGLVYISFGLKLMDINLLRIGFPLLMLFGLTALSMFIWLEHEKYIGFLNVIAFFHIVITVISLVAIITGLVKGDISTIQYALPNFFISGLIFTAIIGNSE